jgi:hypothetical protein
VCQCWPTKSGSNPWLSWFSCVRHPQLAESADTRGLRQEVAGLRQELSVTKEQASQLQAKLTTTEQTAQSSQAEVQVSEQVRGGHTGGRLTRRIHLREGNRSKSKGIIAFSLDWHLHCSTSGWIHIPEPIEMHNRFPFVLHALPPQELQRQLEQERAHAQQV